ncbi:hypothetical protein ACFFRR_005349 [Megaselia abdita]
MKVYTDQEIKTFGKQLKEKASKEEPLKIPSRTASNDPTARKHSQTKMTTTNTPSTWETIRDLVKNFTPNDKEDSWDFDFNLRLLTGEDEDTQEAPEALEFLQQEDPLEKIVEQIGKNNEGIIL